MDGLSQKGAVKHLKSMLSSGKNMEKGMGEVKRVVSKGVKATSKAWPETEKAARAKQKHGVRD